MAIILYSVCWRKLHMRAYIICLPVLVSPIWICIYITCLYVHGFYLSDCCCCVKAERWRESILRCVLGVTVRTLHAALRVNSHSCQTHTNTLGGRKRRWGRKKIYLHKLKAWEQTVALAVSLQPSLSHVHMRLVRHTLFILCPLILVRTFEH